MRISVIIPAAGQGTRMKSAVPKQFLRLRGKSILRHAVEAFEKSGVVDSAVLVAPLQDVDRTREEWLGSSGIVQRVVPGGAKRQDSVYQGLKALDADVDIVVVHDGARPFVGRRVIRECVDAAREYGAAIAAIPVSDTVKRASPQGLVDQTVDRKGLWRVQTPQAFQYALFREAMEKAIADSYYGTDEGSLIEYIGKTVKIVPGSELNIKITRPEDLILGEAIAAAGNFFENED
ncbi:MAG: 2-C-methyl-D-erythritol 4-phosphate cytidylyltransferase [Nitrospinales bacterium]